MKHFIFFISVFFIFSLIGCKSFNENTFTLDEVVASEISKIENINNYNEETIKTLSVLFRTNLSNKYKSMNNINFDKKILNLTKQTTNEIISKETSINFNNNYWSDRINKSEILTFLKLKNIEPANLNEINFIEENGFIYKIIFSSHKINFNEFANYFKLPSNKNIILKNENGFLLFKGYGNTFNFDLDIQEIENLSNKGLSYKEILEKAVKYS